MFGRRLVDSDGIEVEVVDPGRLNTDSGPDFFNSKIKLGGTGWAGNVEIHVKASDWYRHGHDSDPSYDSVILHAVGVSDRRVRRSDGTLIPQVELTMPEKFFLTYDMLQTAPSDIRCASVLRDIPPLAVTDWLESLSTERMQRKSERILEVYRSTGCDWEQTCFIMLARALGFGLNGDPFEMLARSLPLRVLHHHSDNPMQIQALLFGQASMLDSSLHIFDDYYQLLCREYVFLARKYGLRPLRPGLWKYARTRPQNFPHRRIAFLAKACEGGFSLFSRIMDPSKRERELRDLFGWELEGYWHTHFSFDVEARSVSDTLSASSISLLLINMVAPMRYAYGVLRGDMDLAEKSLDLLCELPAESNSIMREWNGIGLNAGNAMRSQALIQLRREYCEARKCLYCRFGHRLLRYSVGIPESAGTLGLSAAEDVHRVGTGIS